MRAPLALGAGDVRAEQILHGGRDLRRKETEIHMLRRARGKAERAARGVQGEMFLSAPFAVRPGRQGILDDVPGRGNGAMREDFTKIILC